MTLSTDSGAQRQALQEARSEQNWGKFDPQTQKYVKPQAPAASTEIDFDSDEPLLGGVCDMSAGCESCQ